MRVSEYFDRIHELLARYSVSAQVVSLDIHRSIRSDQQGYWRGLLTFADGS